MAGIILDKVLNDEIIENELIQWLLYGRSQNQINVDNFSTKFSCSRTDFITFFLNSIHEEIGSSKYENKPENVEGSLNTSQQSLGNEINTSYSCPSDLSHEVLDNSALKTSTPKILKIASESSVMSYASPVSPLYKQNNSFSNKYKKNTPQITPICLGDFIVAKKSSSKKKTGRSSVNGPEVKRRINPTNLAQQRFENFNKTENCFNFNKSNTDELPPERNLLAEEKFKILSRSDIENSSGSPKKIRHLLPEASEIVARLNLVSHKKQLDQIIRIYIEFLNNNLILNLTSEIHFLISLLLKKQSSDLDWTILSVRNSLSKFFISIHNVIYFTAKCLESQSRVLQSYDKSTVKLLMENDRLKEFVPNLIKTLQCCPKNDRTIELGGLQDNVCFNLDTDNRQNFPNDPSFHAFRKQRDLFYEILRLWELHHLTPGYNFTISLGGKIKTLLNLYPEPTNFLHFARLFKSQLLSTCRNGQESPENIISSLGVDAEKFSRLRSRIITQGTSQGLNSRPEFTEHQEFYKEFILVAANQYFNRHLADAFIEEITELNGTDFSSIEVEDKENDVDSVTKKSYYLCIRSLRLLAKFLGLLDSLPYKSDFIFSKHLLTTHIKIRELGHPNFDVKKILEKSIRDQSVILCIPWLTKYLSMLDYTTLRLPYYTSVLQLLYRLNRTFNSGPFCNIYLVKFCLGWLFELPHFPVDDYFNYSLNLHDNSNNMALTKVTLDRLEIVDQNILYFCCPYLEEIKTLLTTNLHSNSVVIKHITPVTALESPEEMSRKKVMQQLEEAFFNGQPVSLRKTVEFVSERIASTCVKYICSTIVPNYKKNALEQFKNMIKTRDQIQEMENERYREDFDEVCDPEQKRNALKTKAQEFAQVCLTEVQKICDVEINAICEKKVSGAIDSLLPLDILPQAEQVCCSVTQRTSIERVKQWINTHVTSAVFLKEFNDEIQKFSSVESKKSKRPVFTLPPNGRSVKHNDTATSGAHLIQKIRGLCIHSLHNEISESSLNTLLDEILKSLNERADINDCVIATMCTVLLDLSLFLCVSKGSLISRTQILSKLETIWKMYYNGCDDLFKSLLCPRNIMILSQSNDIKTSWNTFTKFCLYLIKKQMLSCENFESQCAGIFRTEWNEDTLKRITDFFKQFLELYRDSGGNSSDFINLLNFLSDFCEDLYV